MTAVENDFIAPAHPQPRRDASSPGPRSRVAKILNAAHHGNKSRSRPARGGRVNRCASGFVSPAALLNGHFEQSRDNRCSHITIENALRFD